MSGDADADAAAAPDKKTKAKKGAAKKKPKPTKAEAKATDARALQDAGGWVVHSLLNRKARDCELGTFRTAPTTAAGSAAGAGSAADDGVDGDARQLLHLAKSGAASEALSGADLSASRRS